MTVGDNMADNQIETIETREVGRPCKYETHVEPYLDKIYQWLKEGMTDYSIAEQLGIHQTTWIRYKENYSNLASLYTRAREERNRLVMNRMFAKATGEIAQVKQEKLAKDGKKVVLISEIYTPPDVNAADLFLRNNDPEYKSAKMSNDIGNLTINNFSLDDWQAKRQEILAEIKKLETITTSDYKVIDPDSD
jgi:hypothetical protein